MTPKTLLTDIAEQDKAIYGSEINEYMQGIRLKDVFPIIQDGYGRGDELGEKEYGFIECFPAHLRIKAFFLMKHIRYLKKAIKISG